jgi:hypothetical protein
VAVLVLVLRLLLVLLLCIGGWLGRTPHCRLLALRLAGWTFKVLSQRAAAERPALAIRHLPLLLPPTPVYNSASRTCSSKPAQPRVAATTSIGWWWWLMPRLIMLR